ncbi:hypothetical protein ACFW0H_01175 [Pseudomonas sp. CR3202]|uniref:hypothetical protein n=1 Tax=Pseudomonas sp. CR3202 TaxID=3351532 RepID=UPI003BEF98A8
MLAAPWDASLLRSLVTRLVEARCANPRMELAAHLEGIMNGMLLLAVGAAWSHPPSSNNRHPASFSLPLRLRFGRFTWIFRPLTPLRSPSLCKHSPPLQLYFLVHSANPMEASIWWLYGVYILKHLLFSHVIDVLRR